MAENTIVFVPADGTITIADDSGFDAGNANQYEVKYEGAGSFSTDLGRDIANRASIVIHDREKIVGRRRGQEEPRQVTFDVDVRNFADSGDLNLHDVLYGTNAASAWATIAGYEGHHFHVRFTADATSQGADAVHGVTAWICNVVGVATSEGEPTKASVTIEVLGDMVRFGDGVVSTDTKPA